MSIQHDEKGYVIIGEAALSLALKEKDIEVTSLINELSRMAESSVSDERIYSIFEAKNWLANVDLTGIGAESVPYIKTLTSLNDE